MAQFGGRVKGIIQSASHIVFDSCDTLAQDKLTEAECSETIRLDGQGENPFRLFLVVTVIDIIAKNLLTGIVQQEVDLFQKIH